MEQWLLTLLLTITATTNGQLVDGPYRQDPRRGPDRTNDQLQERYIDYDSYDTTNDDDRGNLQYLSNDEPEPSDQGGTRNRQRVPNKVPQNIRQGPPLQGLQYDDGGPGYGYYQRNCKVRTLPHEQYCDIYYRSSSCNENKAELLSCPNGLVYTGNGRNGLIGVCDYPHRSECVKSVRQSADGYTDEIIEKERHNPPLSTEHCDWLYGIFGHETSCTRYWTCWNGTATEQFCIGGLLYNEDTHACDWPQNVAGCQKHPLCKDDSNGNVPLGKSCNRYWACQGGYPRLQRCPAMLVFDKLRKRCVAPPTVDCDVPPTPPPEEFDGENNGSENRPFRNRNRPSGTRRDTGGTGQRESENRRRFQSGGGGGDIPPPRRERPIQSQGRPLPPQDFNFPDGARPLDPLDRPLDG